MARKSRMSILKRQRELKKAEKAARKRSKKHGTVDEVFSEPQPTVRFGESDDDAASETEEDRS